MCESGGTDGMDWKKCIVIVGHYGSGKTEVAQSLAVSLRRSGEPVTIVDLDLVNPYYRTNDLREFLQREGIDVIAPVYAGTNMDLPVLPPEIYAAFEKKGTVIFDVGGDDDGATALGQFYEKFRQRDYEMLMVVNLRRPMTSDAEEIVSSAREIQAASRLDLSGLLNNTNLSYLSDGSELMESISQVERAAAHLQVPVKALCARREIIDQMEAHGEVLPVDIRLKAF